jgi:pentatricopeptide repeat protein
LEHPDFIKIMKFFFSAFARAASNSKRNICVAVHIMLLLAQKQMNNHLIYRYFVRARSFSSAPPATNSDKRRNVQGNNASATTPHVSKVNLKRLSPAQQGAAPVVRSRPNFTEDFKSSIASPALAWSQGSTKHSIKQASAQHNQNRTSQSPNQPDRFKSSNRYQQLDDDALHLDAKLLAELTAQLPVPREMALERLEAQRAYNRMFTSPAKVAAQISTTNNTSASAPSSGDGPQAVSAKLTWPELHRLIANIQQHPQTSARRASLSKLLKDLHRVRALFSMREHVWKLIHSPNFSHAPSVVEFSIMLHSYAQERLPQKAKALFEDMLAAGLRPDKVAYGTMMNWFVNILSLLTLSQNLTMSCSTAVMPSAVCCKRPRLLCSSACPLVRARKLDITTR